MGASGGGGGSGQAHGQQLPGRGARAARDPPHLQSGGGAGHAGREPQPVICGEVPLRGRRVSERPAARRADLPPGPHGPAGGRHPQERLAWWVGACASSTRGGEGGTPGRDGGRVESVRAAECAGRLRRDRVGHAPASARDARRGLSRRREGTAGAGDLALAQEQSAGAGGGDVRGYGPRGRHDAGPESNGDGEARAREDRGAGAVAGGVSVGSRDAERGRAGTADALPAASREVPEGFGGERSGPVSVHVPRRVWPEAAGDRPAPGGVGLADDALAGSRDGALLDGHRAGVREHGGRRPPGTRCSRRR